MPFVKDGKLTRWKRQIEARGQSDTDTVHYIIIYGSGSVAQLVRAPGS